jgi:carbonic anhydrase
MASLMEVRRLQSDPQTPFAIVLGCADSRAPVEAVFDQYMSDVFVVRVAGNVATPTQIGSIEFAALKFDAPLVVVLGHSECGAVSAVVDQLDAEVAESGDRNKLGHIHSIVDAIQPSVEPIHSQAPRPGDVDDACRRKNELVAACVSANVDEQCRILYEQSEMLRSLVDTRQLAIVGAELDLDSGRVQFHLHEFIVSGAHPQQAR